MSISSGTQFPSNINVGHLHFRIDEGLYYRYLGGVPSNSLNWVVFGGAVSSDPSTVGWSTAQDGAWWFNKTENVVKFWNGSQIVVFQSGDDFLVPPTDIQLQDDFVTGSTSSGTIGTLGWGASNGTRTLIASEQNRPGILRVDSTAVAGTLAILQLYSGSSALLKMDNVIDMTWMNRLNVNDADTITRFGMFTSTGGNPPTTGAYFEKLAPDTNWFAVCRVGGVETRVDTGSAINTSFTTFRIQQAVVGTLVFSLGSAVVSTITTNVPTGLGNIVLQITNNGVAASKTIDIDYFSLKFNNLSR